MVNCNGNLIIKEKYKKMLKLIIVLNIILVRRSSSPSSKMSPVTVLTGR